MFAAAFRDYPPFRYIHQDQAGDDYERQLRRTFLYYIELTFDAGDAVLGCFDGQRLVGGMLMRTPESTDDWTPDTPLTRSFIASVGDAAWQRLDEFELLMERTVPAADGRTFFVDMLGVDPAVQRSGIGRKLLDHVLALAETHPRATRICLCTETEANHEYYRRLGYRPLQSEQLGPICSTGFQRDVPLSD